jgi:hypothetical protein
MDYARIRLLQVLQAEGGLRATVANDFADLERWLPESKLLITYVAGPFPDERQNRILGEWLNAGGRWLALHGTSGGRAVPVAAGAPMRKMVKMPHHHTLGAFFLNHPPLCTFRVEVADRSHPLTMGVPQFFEVTDELYLIELQRPAETHVLLTTELAKDPSPPGFGFAYDKDTSVLADGKTRVLGYVREVGRGSIIYYALGHCHPGATDVQRSVESTGAAERSAPQPFRGSWTSPAFERLLRNAIQCTYQH